MPSSIVWVRVSAPHTHCHTHFATARRGVRASSSHADRFPDTAFGLRAESTTLEHGKVISVCVRLEGEGHGFATCFRSLCGTWPPV